MECQAFIDMIVIVIPARLQSSRLKNKPLAMIGDYPMLWWTWMKAKQSQLAQKVLIATDSQEILNVMQSFGAECVLTSESCQSGSDRVYEASQQIPEANIIVNLQGDEPLMDIKVLDGTIQTLLDRANCQIATAVSPFKLKEDWENPNHVKAVFNSDNKALYFSRAPLAEGWLHIGLYVFRKDALQQFCKLPQSKLELAEKLEQLRGLENEMGIYVYKADISKEHFGVDTPEDLVRVGKILLST